MQHFFANALRRAIDLPVLAGACVLLALCSPFALLHPRRALRSYRADRMHSRRVAVAVEHAILHCTPAPIVRLLYAYADNTNGHSLAYASGIIATPIAVAILQPTTFAIYTCVMLALFTLLLAIDNDIQI